MQWRGVFPAITTPFNADLSVDHDFFARHARWMIDAGCTGIVGLGSLGEGGTLDTDEKLDVLQTLVDAVGDRVPVVCGVSALSTRQAVKLAQDAERLGCKGLMVLPQYVYKGDWRENKAHVSEVIGATNLSCMLYNNPIAYSIDFLPQHMAELAGEHPNLHAVKESAADVRRVTAIRAELGDRLEVFVGVDDLIVEGVAAGAVGWIAGLVNAFPKESVELYDLCMQGKWEQATSLYRWFLPLLRLDVVPKFVQLIKLTQQEVGMGSERVRPPRLELTGSERGETLEVIRTGMAGRLVAAD